MLHRRRCRRRLPETGTSTMFAQAGKCLFSLLFCVFSRYRTLFTNVWNANVFADLAARTSYHQLGCLSVYSICVKMVSRFPQTLTENYIVHNIIHLWLRLFRDIICVVVIDVVCVWCVVVCVTVDIRFRCDYWLLLDIVSFFSCFVLTLSVYVCAHLWLYLGSEFPKALHSLLYFEYIFILSSLTMYSLEHGQCDVVVLHRGIYLQFSWADCECVAGQFSCRQNNIFNNESINDTKKLCDCVRNSLCLTFCCAQQEFHYCHTHT